MTETSWIGRYIQPTPKEKHPQVVRDRVEGMTCPACGSDDVMRYPVANQHGARIATKCQACLHTLALERPGPDDWWPPFRSLTYDWPASIAERGSRERLIGGLGGAPKAGEDR